MWTLEILQSFSIEYYCYIIIFYYRAVIDLSSVLKPFGQNEAQDEERPAEEFVMCMNVM